MGREIRRVPADWEHPKYTGDDAPTASRIGSYRPLFDEDYESACVKWYREAADFKPTANCRWYHEWNGDPPDARSYRDRAWTAEEATHWQVYETVSEGTPVTPHFATKEELVDYLVAHGDFWDQQRGDGGWNRSSAERFVASEWAPTMVVSSGVIQTPRDS